MFAPSIFESFNARDLRPEQVAKSFVPSSAFEQLHQRNSSLLLGPRGSGKTTLMRMLDCETASFWAGDIAKEYKSRLDFVGVFIPTDRVWQEQMKVALEEVDKSENPLRVHVVDALFSSHVLFRLARTMKFRFGITSNMGFDALGLVEVSDKNRVEAQIVEELANAWRLNPLRATFTSLISSCSRRKSELAALSMQPVVELEQRRDEVPDVYSSFNLLVESGLEIFGEYAKTTGEKWALLFDELELAPQKISTKLLKMARGGNEKILYKLSLAPYFPDQESREDILSPKEGNDFSQIVLWHSTRESQADLFFNDLVRQILDEEGFSDLAIENLFQSPKTKDLRTLYHDLVSRDVSLRKLFKKYSIPIDIGQLEGDVNRAQTIRKLQPVALVRDAHTSPSKKNSKPRYRSLNRYPDIYGGIKNLSIILEGNPRWIIGVIRPLIKKYAAGERPVSIASQMREIDSAAKRFLSLLQSIPCGESSKRKPTSAKNLLDVIGFHISDVVNIRDLKWDVPTFISISADISSDVKDGLGNALNAGGLVYMSGTTTKLMLDKLDDRQFRICHLLSPHYRLPLVSTKPYSLKQILSEKNNDFPLAGDLFK